MDKFQRKVMLTSICLQSSFTEEQVYLYSTQLLQDFAPKYNLTYPLVKFARYIDSNYTKYMGTPSQLAEIVLLKADISRYTLDRN